MLFLICELNDLQKCAQRFNQTWSMNLIVVKLSGILFCQRNEVCLIKIIILLV